MDLRVPLRFRLSDETLRGDYVELKMKMGEQQRMIDEQNEMLDEAQVLIQKLVV